MLSMLPGIVILGLVAVVSIVLSHRQLPPENVAQRLAAASALAITIVLQGVHFAEETATGFNEQFPALFGLPAIPLPVFAIFNVTWIGIWIISVPGVRSARSSAFFAAWFLAIAGALNGVAHPLMALAVGGYFPGLVTSPFIGVAGICLWLRLSRAAGPIGVNSEHWQVTAVLDGSR